MNMAMVKDKSSQNQDKSSDQAIGNKSFNYIPDNLQVFIDPLITL